jgi:hypothetical protein
MTTFRTLLESRLKKIAKAKANAAPVIDPTPQVDPALPHCLWMPIILFSPLQQLIDLWCGCSR